MRKVEIPGRQVGEIVSHTFLEMKLGILHRKVNYERMKQLKDVVQYLVWEEK